MLKRELDIYKNNNEIAQQQQVVSESVVDLENEIQLLKCDMQNTNLTLNDLEMRYNMMVMDENIRLREEIQTLRTSFQSIQFQVLSFMKYIKGALHTNTTTTFTKPIMNQKSKEATSTNPSSSFIPTTYNSSKLIKSTSTSFESNQQTSSNPSTDIFNNYNFSTSSRTRSNSDTGTSSTNFDNIHRERRFSKI